MKRPLLWVMLLYVGGILLGSWVTLPVGWVLGVALGLAVLAVAWAGARPVLLYPLVLMAGCANVTSDNAAPSPNDLRRILNHEADLVTVRGTLRQSPVIRNVAGREDYHTTCEIDVTDLRLKGHEWQPAFGRMIVTSKGALTNFVAGQMVEIGGTAAVPEQPPAQGMFDYRNYLAKQGIHYELEADPGWRILDTLARPPLADWFRDWGRKALALGLPGEDQALRLEWALTLGCKEELKKEEDAAEVFKRAATYHIFAVDGLRMAIVFGICFGLLRAVGLPRNVSGLVMLPVIWFYVALTGWAASAIRASVMLSVIVVGWVLRRPSDLMNSLFAAALIILTWAPKQLFEAGFQLSFLVVLFILLIIPVLDAWAVRLTAGDPLLPPELQPRWRQVLRGPARYGGDLFFSSFAAWLASLPLAAYYFNLFTPVSTPANILAVPLCGLTLISNIASLLLAGWFSGAAVLFNHAGWGMMRLITVTSAWFEKWPGAWCYVQPPSVYAIILFYTFLLTALTGWLFKPRHRFWKIGTFVVAGLVWCGQHWIGRPDVRITVLAMNGGSATYVQGLRNSDQTLIDCGSTNAAAAITKPFLEAQGVNSIGTLVLTHGDAGRVGGEETLASEFPIGQVVLSPIHFRSPAYRQIQAGLKRSPERDRTVSRGAKWGPWTVLHPESTDHFPQADDNALVLMGTFGDTRVLLLSDLGRRGQEALIERTSDLHADIVVSGVPAAGEALAETLIDAVKPRLIIISDSKYPPAKRASPALQERLARRGIEVIYTRSSGAVALEVHNKRWEVRTMSGIRIRSDDPAPSPRRPPASDETTSRD